MTFEASFIDGSAFGATFSGAETFESEYGEVIEVGGGGEPYTGSYTVTPSVSEQTLETAGKTMDRDVTVYGMPVYDGGVR